MIFLRMESWLFYHSVIIFFPFNDFVYIHFMKISDATMKSKQLEIYLLIITSERILGEELRNAFNREMHIIISLEFRSQFFMQQ